MIATASGKYKEQKQSFYKQRSGESHPQFLQRIGEEEEVLSKEGEVSAKLLKEYMASANSDEFTSFFTSMAKEDGIQSRLTKLATVSVTKGKETEAIARQLQTLAAALCIELYAWRIFTKFTALISEKQEIKHVYKKKQITLPIEKSFTPDGGPGTFSSLKIPETTEGISFYFRFVNGAIKNYTYAPEEMKMLESGEKLDNSGNEEVASWLKIFLGNAKKKNNRRKLFALRSKVESFITTFNPFMKKLEKTPLERGDQPVRIIESCTSFVQIFNSMCLQFKEDFLSRKSKVLDDTTITQPKSKRSKETLLEQKRMLLALEGEIRNNRAEQFQTIMDKLKELRNLQKNRGEFMTYFFSHYLKFIPIEFKDYLERHQKYFKTEEQARPVEAPPAKTKQGQHKPTQKRRRGGKARNTKRKRKTKLITKSEQPPSVQPEQKLLSREIQVRPPVEQSPLLFPYASRVQDWFQDKPSQLQNLSYSELGENEKYKQKIYHGFSLEVEQYIKSHGFEERRYNGRYRNEDTLYCIPGEIQFYQEDRVVNERGVFTFCIGHDGQMYHRHFTKRIHEDLYRVAQNVFYKMDYPALQEGARDKISLAGKKEIVDKKLNSSINTLTGAVAIPDPENHVRYILYKTG